MRLIGLFKKARTNVLTVVLAGAQLAVGSVIIQRALSGTATGELLAERAPEAASGGQDWSSPERHFDAATLDSRPLFSRSRRPPEPAPVVVVATPRPSLQIVGTMLLPGRPPVALLTRGSGETLRVRLGDDVEGWVVREIAARTVVLERGDERFEVVAEESGRGRSIANAVAEQRANGGTPSSVPIGADGRIYRAPQR